MQFETPENIVVTYRPAGFGSRFIAWLIDQTLLLALFFGAALVAAVLAFSRVSMWDGEWRTWQREGGMLAWVAVFALAFIAVMLLNALAFAVMEWVGGGRTVGKKIMKLRVVRVDGFTLDAVAIGLRNLTRLLDFALLLPPLMLPTLFVAFVTQHRQRLGDLFAGTMVVGDGLPVDGEVLRLREKLERCDASNAGAVKFHFAGRGELPANWRLAAEKTLARWEDLTDEQAARLREKVVLPLAEKYALTAPDAGDEPQFLADLLTDIYRREYRRLG
ncbi:hypothetical protein FACS1894139_08560 [Planctomycetales bacterium]|nr:hypothetical protein FACS1894107_05620 [Planctomycetales bacterium]GHS96675.1 hypothetical protein FACS1894108_01700 [Planctomycetales bacterium]GHT05175.1 hypothetical protein FACS1894139_08560 [Planctomycetales bacterium]